MEENKVIIKNKFSGWKDVFSFTLHQTTKGKAFTISTIAFALCLFLAVLATNIIAASLSDKKASISPITIVYVVDESGLSSTDFSIISQSEDITYSGIEFIAEAADKNVEDIANNLETTEVLLHITKEENQYSMRLVLPSVTEISKEDGEKLLNQLVPFFEMNKLTQIGLSEVQLSSINMPINTTFISAGEDEETIGEILIKMLSPMLFALVLYIMLLLYGQSICKALITEKTSKLMEMLLTSVTPYALITGKILAMTFLGIFQFVLWIGSVVVGFTLGDYIAKSMYPEYNNIIANTFELIKSNADASAFSIPAIILAVLALCLGFLFYCVLAGMVGAVLNKAEDLSNGMALYQIPVIISFFIAYFIPLQEESSLINVVKYFPLTSPFLIPADLLIGNMGITEGCIALLILAIAALFLIILTGKIYKGMVLFNGSKLSFKNMINLLKAK